VDGAKAQTLKSRPEAVTAAENRQLDGDDDMTTHSGRVAVVSGAARGIGQAIAAGLAARGATVVGVDLIDAEETGRLVAASSTDWLSIIADVSSPDGVAGVADQVLKRFGRCDILVNNAGIFPACPFDEMSFEAWRNIISINLDSQFLMSRAFVPAMKERGWGRIVNMTSGSVQLVNENTSAYKASKMGTIGLTRGMSADLGKYGITVNAASPSLTRTPGVLSSPNAADRLEMIAQRQAIKRVSQPNDVVGLILFLTSEDSHFVTGQTVLADGGLSYF
jgi:NAD(P)-dependent dehydrogenase (short-subunit alcohol dehydrogenase family)